jgi:hypothetical protein
VAARAGAGAAVALALGAALAACGSAHTASGQHAASYPAAAAVHRQPATAAQGSGSAPAPGSGLFNTSITLHIANTSNQVLRFVKVDFKLPHQAVNPAPAKIVGGNGGTDTINLSSTDPGGSDMEVTYLVGDTTQEITGSFKVPTSPLTSNTAACTGLKAGPDCSIEHGETYHPNASWTITPSQVPAPSLGPAGTAWSFTKIGAAGSPQLLEVNEAQAGLGLYGVDTWQQTMSGNAIQANQLWTYQPAGDTGYGQLVNNDYDGYCLQAVSTYDVAAHPCTDGTASQLWRAVPGQAAGIALQVKSSGAYLNAHDPGFGNGDAAQMSSQQRASLTDWAATPAS